MPHFAFLFLKSSQLFLTLLWMRFGPPIWDLKFSDAFFQFLNPIFVETSCPTCELLLEDLKRKQWNQYAASFSTLYSNQSYSVYHASRNDLQSGPNFVLGKSWPIQRLRPLDKYAHLILSLISGIPYSSTGVRTQWSATTFARSKFSETFVCWVSYNIEIKINLWAICYTLLVTKQLDIKMWNQKGK
jgi:hypothetical protein